jgi:hypothetical protein
VRVNSLDPGTVRTVLRAAAYPGEDPRPLPSPEDIMDAYLYPWAPLARHTGAGTERPGNLSRCPAIQLGSALWIV